MFTIIFLTFSIYLLVEINRSWEKIYFITRETILTPINNNVTVCFILNVTIIYATTKLICSRYSYHIQLQFLLQLLKTIQVY